MVLKVSATEVRRVPWSQLAPAGVLRARAALAKPDDGPARLALAELASELGLYAEARVEYEKALALGAITGKACAEAIGEAEERAVEAGVARAAKAADSGDVDGALAIARGLKLDFAAARNAKRVDGLLADLAQRIATRKKEQDQAQKELDQIALQVDRTREILRRSTEAKKQVELGDRTAGQAKAAMPKGSITDVRKATEASDLAYQTARRELGRVRRVAPQGSKERDEAGALLAQVDKSEFRLLFSAAKFFWDARVYKAAEEFAARASYLDPVEPGLLELRTEIRENRIRYRVSDLTNAKPR